jgi:hypothetical protein
MTVTAAFLYNQQYTAMLDQVKGYGGSLAKFMATQNAVPLLSEDWAAIDVFIQETLSRQDFNYIVVADDKGVIRGANDIDKINEKYELPDLKPMVCTTPEDGREPLARRQEAGRFHRAHPVPGQGTAESPSGSSRRRHQGRQSMLVLLTILTLITSAAVAGGRPRSRACPPICVQAIRCNEPPRGQYDTVSPTSA